MEIAFATVFALDYLFRLSLAPDRLKYILALTSILDFVTFVPSLITTVFSLNSVLFDEDSEDLATSLRTLRIFRAFRIARFVKVAPTLGLQRQLFLLGLGVFGTILFTCELGRPSKTTQNRVHIGCVQLCFMSFWRMAMPLRSCSFKLVCESSDAT
jgi:hypothetical protein